MTSNLYERLPVAPLIRPLMVVPEMDKPAEAVPKNDTVLVGVPPDTGMVCEYVVPMSANVTPGQPTVGGLLMVMEQHVVVVALKPAESVTLTHSVAADCVAVSAPAAAENTAPAPVLAKVRPVGSGDVKLAYVSAPFPPTAATVKEKGRVRTALNGVAGHVMVGSGATTKGQQAAADVTVNESTTDAHNVYEPVGTVAGLTLRAPVLLKVTPVAGQPVAGFLMYEVYVPLPRLAAYCHGPAA